MTLNFQGKQSPSSTLVTRGDQRDPVTASSPQRPESALQDLPLSSLLVDFFLRYQGSSHSPQMLPL